MKHLILNYLFLFAPLCLTAQSIGAKLTAHQEQYPLEKVYIAHDRPYYAPGDTIWCQAYLVEGRSHRSFENEPVLHVDWLNKNGQCLKSYLLKIQDGTAAFEIPTAPNDSSGIYHLRAYTQYQRNFDPSYQFQKSILLTKTGIPPEKVTAVFDFSLQFFPEGGYTVFNCPGKVAFLATSTSGEPIPISGLLREKGGTPLRAIEAVHEGMGVFSFTPEPGKEYEVVGSYKDQEKVFPLPPSLSKGYQLSVNNRADAYIEFSIRPSPGLSLEGLQIVGHIRGQVFLDEVIEEQALYGRRIPRSAVPSGLIHLTLFDQKSRPLNERLLFNRNETMDIQVTMNQKADQYAPRSPVQFDLTTLQNQTPIKAKLSVSVYNSDLIKVQKEGLNIQNYLWLQSDLPYPIPNAHQYLQTNDASSRLLLDYVLLTRGWRRFNWQEVLTREPVINYPSQEHIAVAGKVLKRGKPVKADVFLNVLNQADFTSINLTTQEDGLFLFNGFDFTDSTELVLQANEFNPRNKKKRKKDEAKRTGNTNVDIERIELNALPFRNRPVVLPGLPPERASNYAAVVEHIQTTKAAYRDILIEEIEALEVTGSRLSTYQEQEKAIRAEYRELGIPYSPQARKFFTDNLADKGQRFTDIYEMIGAQFPNVIVDRQEPFNKKIVFNNRNDGILTQAGYAILVVDGMIIDQNQGNTPPPILPLDIKNISLYPAVEASRLFGEQARGGAVVIVTRKEPVQLGDQTAADIKGMLRFTHPGYYQARTFFTPDYSQPQKVNRPDLRTTLYWNPKVKTSEEVTQLSFYTGDQTGTFTIQIEGISSDGVPFVHWEEIDVKY